MEASVVWIIAIFLAFPPIALLRRNLWQLARKHLPAVSGKVGLGGCLSSFSASSPHGPWGSLQDQLRKEAMAGDEMLCVFWEGVRCSSAGGISVDLLQRGARPEILGLLAPQMFCAKWTTITVALCWGGSTKRLFRNKQALSYFFIKNNAIEFSELQYSFFPPSGVISALLKMHFK